MRSRFSFLGLLLAGLVLASPACTYAAEEAADGPTLTIGDKAPALQDVNWVQGTEVPKYEDGKVYIAEFWATWCGPCIASFPHLDKLANEYADQGLVVVAVTTEGPSNTMTEVDEFLKGDGKDYKFHYAFCETEKTYQAYMEAAQQNGIPCSYVIDRKGNIAFIGHPMDLDSVLPKVIDGTWRGKEDAELYASLNEKMSSAAELAQTDPKAALAIFDEVEKAFPPKAKTLQFGVLKALCLTAADKPAEAAALLKEQIAHAKAEKDARTLIMLAGMMASPPLGEQAEIAPLWPAAVNDALAIDPDNWQVKLQAAMLYNSRTDDKAKAKKLADEAYESIPDAETKASIKAFMDQQFGSDDEKEED
ncbi:TlpA disulfide reductase family protein [Bremerella cremea]|uniref:TlpA disulfide reductase family protein n=1 Tax=Bremerella cremea TaxID=1031537 RepID=UPI0031F05FB3